MKVYLGKYVGTPDGLVDAADVTPTDVVLAEAWSRHHLSMGGSAGQAEHDDVQLSLSLLLHPHFERCANVRSGLLDEALPATTVAAENVHRDRSRSPAESERKRSREGGPKKEQRERSVTPPHSHRKLEPPRKLVVPGGKFSQLRPPPRTGGPTTPTDDAASSSSVTESTTHAKDAARAASPACSEDTLSSMSSQGRGANATTPPPLADVNFVSLTNGSTITVICLNPDGSVEDHRGTVVNKGLTWVTICEPMTNKMAMLPRPNSRQQIVKIHHHDATSDPRDRGGQPAAQVRKDPPVPSSRAVPDKFEEIKRRMRNDPTAIGEAIMRPVQKAAEGLPLPPPPPPPPSSPPPADESHAFPLPMTPGSYQSSLPTAPVRQPTHPQAVSLVPHSSTRVDPVPKPTASTFYEHAPPRRAGLSVDTMQTRYLAHAQEDRIESEYQPPVHPPLTIAATQPRLQPVRTVQPAIAGPQQPSIAPPPPVTVRMPANHSHTSAQPALNPPQAASAHPTLRYATHAQPPPQAPPPVEPYQSKLFTPASTGSSVARPAKGKIRLHAFGKHK